MIKQQRVTAWCCFAGVIMGVIIIIIFWLYWRKDDDKEDWVCFPIIATVIWIIITAVLANTIFTGFLNPEYGAIKDIARLFV